MASAPALQQTTKRWRARRDAHLRARRRRVLRTFAPPRVVVAPPAAPAKGLPLPLAVALAVGVHALVYAGLWLGELRSARWVAAPPSTPISLQVVEPPAPEEPPTVVEEPTPAARQAPKPTPRAEAPPAPADPVNMEPEAKEPTPVAEPPRRRIVGLSLESTVASGGGPAYAVGNTRMGRTAAVAESPEVAEALPPPTNRVSQRVSAPGSTLSEPKRLTTVEPEYPPELRAQGIEGDVVVSVEIDRDGNVVSATVVKGTRYPELDVAALQAARKQRYTPATRDGVAVPYTLTYTYRFRLDG